MRGVVAGPNVNGSSQKLDLTPIMAAVFGGHGCTTKLLIAKGADLEICYLGNPRSHGVPTGTRVAHSCYKR